MRRRMKNIFKYLLSAAFAAAAASACTGVMEKSAPLTTTQKDLVFTATRETLSPGTRSLRMDDGSVWWNTDEEVSLFYGSGEAGGSKFVSTNKTISEAVGFSGSVQVTGTISEAGEDIFDYSFWAVYPYSSVNSCDGRSVTMEIPARQTGVEGNFSDNVFPAVAQSTTLNLAFWNVCGGIKFFITRSDIKSVSFRGNNGEVLAGKARVSFNEYGHPEVTEAVSGITKVTLTAPEGGTFKPGKYYYITLLPATLEQGFTMTFENDAQKGTFISDKAQTVKRSTFGLLKGIDARAGSWADKDGVVDLGLSVKWATCNVGASKPEEYGEYFAWGETEPKSDYSWTTYKWCNGSSNSLTKYCPLNMTSYWGGSGAPDNKTVLDFEDDAAYANLGGSWRMPTKAEWEELMENCAWTWTDDYNGTGIAGLTGTSKKPGYEDKSIFFPAVGCRIDTYLEAVGSEGDYMSSSLDPDSPYYSHSYYVSTRGWGEGGYHRLGGRVVRPVSDGTDIVDMVPVSGVSLSDTALSLNPGDSFSLTATVQPSNAFDKTVTWSSSDDSIASVNQDGLVTAVGPGLATISVTTSNGGKTAYCLVTVNYEPYSPPVAEAVDLGLSVKWASFNIGAASPDDLGDYFAWGETKPKSDYSWSTYKWCNGSYITLTKYCLSDGAAYWGGSGSPDGKTDLEIEDDAAIANWGGSWRMPTPSEWKELIDNCTWTWTNNYNDTGIAGYILNSKKTGYTNKSIFLPAAGYYWDGTDLYNVGSYGRYWSSSLNTDNPTAAWNVNFNSGNILRNSFYRASGLSVRPVSE